MSQNQQGGGTGGTFQCEACGMSFNSQQELQQHGQQEHGK
jgi:hypothetical protein